MKFQIPFLLFGCSLMACVSTKIESNKVAGFDKKIERVYLKIQTKKETYALMNDLSKELTLMLEKKKVQVKSGTIRELDLGEDATKVLEEMAYFQPDLILTLNMNENNSSWTLHPHGGMTYQESKRLTATLGNFPQDQPVWKAVLRSTANLPDYGARNIAKKLMGRLESDGMIKIE